MRSAAFPLRAYSEFMPPPYVGMKPYAPDRGALRRDVRRRPIRTARHRRVRAGARSRARARSDRGAPGRRARQAARGEPHALSQTLLEGNPAWPAELAAARAAARSVTIRSCSRSAARAVAHAGRQGQRRAGRCSARATTARRPVLGRSSTRPRSRELLAWVAGMRRASGASSPRVRPIVPAPARGARRRSAAARARHVHAVRAAAGASPRRVSRARARARAEPGQPRACSSIRGYRAARARAAARDADPAAAPVPARRGQLRDPDPAVGLARRGQERGGARPSRRRRRSSAAIAGSGSRATRASATDAYHDKVSVALFSTDPVDDRSLRQAARAQLADLDRGLPAAARRPERRSAMRSRAPANAVDAGGRFGYRMYYPPMRAGVREVFWHFPLVARAKPRALSRGAARLRHRARPTGSRRIGLAAAAARAPAHVAAARAVRRATPATRATRRATTSASCSSARELLGEPLRRRSRARCCTSAKHDDARRVARRAAEPRADHAAGGALARHAAALIGADRPPARRSCSISSARARSRSRSGRSIAQPRARRVSPEERRRRHRGQPRQARRARRAKAAHIARARAARSRGARRSPARALSRADRAARHDGRAEVVDHVFRWETDFAFPWMDGWAKNQDAPAERNIVLMIPGKRPRRRP